MSTQRPPTIDPQAAQRWASRRPGPSPWLHEEVARRMEERLAWIKLKPQIWAHWQPVTGGLQAHDLLSRRYPEAGCVVSELTPSHDAYANDQLTKPWWNPARWVGAPARFQPPAAASVQMLWANMALHMAADPQDLMSQWHQALATGGFLMFSCLGPDTLARLHEHYRRLGWPAPSHEFTDMHDWGDMLVAAGFAEPVMDMERITLSFQTPERMLEELRGLGRNLHSERFARLRGRQWHQQLLATLSQGPLELEFEVIYGHAFKPLPRMALSSETVLTLDQMKDSLRQAKNRQRSL